MPQLVGSIDTQNTTGKSKGNGHARPRIQGKTLLSDLNKKINQNQVVHRQQPVDNQIVNTVFRGSVLLLFSQVCHGATGKELQKWQNTKQKYHSSIRPYTCSPDGEKYNRRCHINQQILQGIRFHDDSSAIFSEKYRCCHTVASKLIFKTEFLKYLFAETANYATFAARF